MAPAVPCKTRGCFPAVEVEKWKVASPIQAQAGGRPAVGVTTPFAERQARGPALFAHRHRSERRKRGGGQRSFVQGRLLGIIGTGHHPRQGGRAYRRTGGNADRGVISVFGYCLLCEVLTES